MRELKQKALQNMLISLKNYEYIDTIKKQQITYRLLNEEQRKLVKEKDDKIAAWKRRIKNIEQSNNKLKREIKKEELRYEQKKEVVYEKRVFLKSQIDTISCNVKRLIDYDMSEYIKKYSAWKIRTSLQDDILESVCEDNNISMHNLLYWSNEHSMKMARVDAIIRLKDIWLTYARIWKIFNWRNHAAIMYMYKKYKDDKNI